MPLQVLKETLQYSLSGLGNTLVGSTMPQWARYEFGDRQLLVESLYTGSLLTVFACGVFACGVFAP